MKRLLPLVLLVLAGSAAALPAQVPDRFENLQVLPRDIPRDSLLRVMRGISMSLGVRCAYCHVAREGTGNSEGYNFASDDKRTKRTARFMMRMARDLNANVLAELPDRSDPPVRVTCMTCHRGMPVPTTTEGILAQTIDSAGVQAAIARYRQLRAENLERGRLDFSEGPVNEVARELITRGAYVDAMALLELNAELHPAAASVDVLMGDVHRARGEREQAVSRYRRALEKEPDNRAARRWLDELQPTP